MTRAWLLALAIVLAGCSSTPAHAELPVTTTLAVTTGLPVAPGGETPASIDVRAMLAPLAIDDHPSPGTLYRREEWPTWADIDHGGCDAREQAPIAPSTTPARVGPNCTVIADTWTSPYDGVETTVPGDLDADHMVPLANVHQSGGWQWDAATRRAYANDQAVLVMVTAHANRSKGDSAPDGWRPTLESDWCAYASQWVALKIHWRLSATTRERDALGQMLDTCAY
jgi:hypothetical protein